MNGNGWKGQLPWRVGNQVGRTIYDANDILIGVMDTRDLAVSVVSSVNARPRIETHTKEDIDGFDAIRSRDRSRR
jgi:hypothetical protein